MSELSDKQVNEKIKKIMNLQGGINCFCNSVSFLINKQKLLKSKFLAFCFLLNKCQPNQRHTISNQKKLNTFIRFN